MKGIKVFLLSFLCVPVISLAYVPVEFEACFQGASAYTHIDVRILEAIAKVESDYNPYSTHVNKDGSVDMGIMQINSTWLPELRQYGISRRDLYNPCINIYVGAWVLKQCIMQEGETWKAIDCYNKGAGNAHETSVYVWKVYKAIRKLLTYSRK